MYSVLAAHILLERMCTFSWLVNIYKILQDLPHKSYWLGISLSFLLFTNKENRCFFLWFLSTKGTILGKYKQFVILLRNDYVNILLKFEVTTHCSICKIGLYISVYTRLSYKELIVGDNFKICFSVDTDLWNKTHK